MTPLLPLLFFFLLTIHDTHAFTLISFDVDGTLVRGSGPKSDDSAHARAFSHACSQVLANGSTQVPPVASALPREKFHGSTDGLILCRLANATLGTDDVSEDQLEEMFRCMYDYVAALPDEVVAEGIETLPGVLEKLNALAGMSESVRCGLVTGNVEGIARRKMRAVGVWQTGALAPPSAEQETKTWKGSEDIGFLGGFGSDYCSRNILDFDRNYLDRGEQIAIAARRCRSTLESPELLKRVVHVGDAPADVLAAKTYAQKCIQEDSPLCVGLVGVATGSYAADILKEAAGDPIPGKWEPVILEEGMADPYFLEACGI